MKILRVVAISGGTGSAKLLRGLKAEIGRFTVVANVGDNIWMHGLCICPDIDTALYTLAGISDTGKGWGLANDTFHALEQMSRFGAQTWFNLGDRDLALHILRTEMLRRGRSLTEITEHIRRALGIDQIVLPVTNASVETHILTAQGELHLQEFWVKKRAIVSVRGVRYRGAQHALPSRQVMSAIRRADKIIICPANPITSIMPVLAVKGMKTLIASSNAETLAVSPMIANHPYSGPAGKLMRATGHRTDSVAVARMYSGLVDKFVIDSSDLTMKEKIEELGIRCLTTSTIMSNHHQERALARFLMRN